MKKETKKASHDLLNAITFETASASLLLHLACGSMASSSTVTVPGGWGEFNVLLVDSWREIEQPVTPLWHEGPGWDLKARIQATTWRTVFAYFILIVNC